MQTVSLGKTGLILSKIGFGGIPIQRLSQTQAIVAIRHAFDRGINWLDTANSYGSSEERFGQALKTYDRDSFYVFTKAIGKTPEELAQQVELSFERLQLDYIDLYQFHCVSVERWQQMCKNGTVDYLCQLKQQGRIRHIGISSHEISAVLEIAADPIVETVQWPFNFIAVEDSLKVLEKCRANDIGFIAMKPFGGGVLDSASACIRFLMQYAEVAPDPGFESIEQIDEVLQLVEENAPLSESDKAHIERYKKELGESFCRRCGYCQPCPEGVSIMLLMNLNNIIARFSADQVLTGMFADAAATLEKCNDCGECETKCPYKLKIRPTMQQNFQLFQQLKQKEQLCQKDWPGVPRQ